MIYRLAITSALAFALCSCASYDAGYRQGYADRNLHVGVIVDGGTAAGYGDYDVLRNGYYGGYGYPYEYASYGLDPRWQPGFGFGPWFYQPWYGYGYPYGWHYPHHRHHRRGGGHHDVAANWLGSPYRQTHAGSIPNNPAGNAGVGRTVENVFPGNDQSRNAPRPARFGIPSHERSFNSEPPDPPRITRPRPHR